MPASILQVSISKCSSNINRFLCVQQAFSCTRDKWMFLYLHSSRSLMQHPQGRSLNWWPRLSRVRLPRYKPVRFQIVVLSSCQQHAWFFSLISSFCITVLFVCSLLLFFLIINFTWSHPHFLAKNFPVDLFICNGL